MQIATINKYVKDTDQNLKRLNGEFRHLADVFAEESKFITENKDLFTKIKTKIVEHSEGIK